MLHLNTSYKHHSTVAIILAVWLAGFLILIAPFDIAELPFAIRLEVMPFYGVISFISYLILIPIQNWVFKKSNKWNLLLEVLIILSFNILVLIGSFLYYKSGLINGKYSFSKFSIEVYSPIFFIVLPMLLFTRWYLNKKIVSQETEKIVLTGENKLDILQLHFSDLVCISSADNYVEIAYLINTTLHKKLLRTTLKNIHLQQPQLIKTHRSYLINSMHFKEWKNSTTLILTHKEVPVSKNYKNSILAMNHSPLKTDHSSLSS